MPVPQTRWPSLARDLAILTMPYSPVSMEDIFRTYETDKDEIAQLLATPEFVKRFEKEMSVCEQAGDKAVVRYRTSTLSQALAEKLFRDAINDAMKPGEALKLLDLLLKTAGLMAEEKAATNVAVQTNVTLPLPHVEKIAHCFAKDEAIDV